MIASQIAVELNPGPVVVVMMRIVAIPRSS